MDDVKIQAETTIPVVVETELPARGMLNRPQLTTTAVEEMSTGVLARSFERIMSTMDEIVERARTNSAATTLDEITLSLQVKADVGFALIGNVGSGSQASIQVKLKARKDTALPA